MYEVFNGTKWLRFDSYYELLTYLSNFNVNYGNVKSNTFLDEVGCNDNDTYFLGFGAGGSDLYMPRRFRIVIDGRMVSAAEIRKDVLNFRYDDKKYLEIMRKNRGYKPMYYAKWGYIPDSAYPEFRRGPWPYIHNRHNYKVYRHIHTYNELKSTTDPDYLEFTRKSRGKNLPTLFMDEPLRDWRNTGWKRQGHNRHQWELKVKNRTKHEHKGAVDVINNRRIKSIRHLDLDDAA